ncbi:hypothetical protein EDD30_6657 [Couchioplanes caeruleus]|uniref:Uncharacterized protein n=2 Tax=Couchioplanes caeruleus TaxID=56438 RepID=A0A1K0GRG6_9ACTN|nr:hypothetical protein BG844_24010 [Couchioplanes caeruleus subsp. caeruleus]ROP33637.1 hypothetical protein EDD30_6657 [Couchioplanes caeruleus]
MLSGRTDILSTSQPGIFCAAAGATAGSAALPGLGKIINERARTLFGTPVAQLETVRPARTALVALGLLGSR